MLGLLAAGESESIEVRAGAEYLVGTQNAEGTWSEEPFTGTGFPRVFYLKYHMYPMYFPLMALSRLAAVTSHNVQSRKVATTRPRLSSAS
jgi:squalene-hopene/tetraprenyl-beta-curcumene cyclase